MVEKPVQPIVARKVLWWQWSLASLLIITAAFGVFFAGRLSAIRQMRRAEARERAKEQELAWTLGYRLYTDNDARNVGDRINDLMELTNPESPHLRKHFLTHIGVSVDRLPWLGQTCTGDGRSVKERWILSPSYELVLEYPGIGEATMFEFVANDETAVASAAVKEVGQRSLWLRLRAAWNEEFSW